MGIALVPESTISLKFDNVVFQPLSLPEGVQIEFHLVWREDNDNPGMKTVKDAILDNYQQRTSVRMENKMNVPTC